MTPRSTDGGSALALTGLRFVVLGAGRLGSSLALALRARGAELAGYTCNTPRGRSRAEEWLGSPAATGLHDLVSSSPAMYVISVPDDVLSPVALELAQAMTAWAAGHPLGTEPATAPLVIHTSGVTSVDVLSPCAERGALTLAFHPLQTFSEPFSGSTRFPGAAIAVTPPRGAFAAAALDAGFSLARALGAHPFRLADEKRVLYHAAACVASNYLVTLESCAERLFLQAGMPREQTPALFLPLVRATLDNLAAQGAAAALTGPLSRGDASTVSDHLKELSQSAPDVDSVYRCMGLATLELVRARGDVDSSSLSKLAELLGSTERIPIP